MRCSGPVNANRFVKTLYNIDDSVRYALGDEISVGLASSHRDEGITLINPLKVTDPSPIVENYEEIVLSNYKLQEYIDNAKDVFGYIEDFTCVRVKIRVPVETYPDLRSAPLHRTLPRFFEKGLRLYCNAEVSYETKDKKNWILECDILVEYPDDIGTQIRFQSAFTSSIFEREFECTATEGVCFQSFAVEPKLSSVLMKAINSLSETKTPDYHPNSNNIVLDHVHPALYSYIHGVSKVVASQDIKDPSGL